ncbi:MAG: sulfotransferase [Anaerolineales bacterium]|nr:sulfotransferase [Anaerolineales bacterium]NUQ86523.1 sulfotransferase [Anaerolineales bacterium]
MHYNFRLFWRTFYRSFFDSKNTPARLTKKRIIFLLLFYVVWIPGSLVHWFCFWLDDILFPAHKMQKIEKPLFILGNLRSGSTFLHRLLSRDSETFTSLTTWDIYLTPSVTQKKITQFVSRLDKKYFNSALHRLLYAFDRATLGKFKIHPISFFQPEEDENIHLHIWDGFFVTFLFPFMDEFPNYQHFDEALAPEHKRRIMAFYKSMLQRHMYATGKKYYVAKAPAFSAKIESLIEFFPDARIIYLARNPLDMLPSTVSWINYARLQFTDPAEKGYLYLDEIVDFTQHWYRHPLQYLDSHPSPRHLILNYEDLVQRPEAVLRAFYEQFGYPDKPGLEEIVDQAVKETLTFQSDHTYSYEDMGFTREGIVALYTDIFERFGFDKREYEPTKARAENVHATD